MLLQFSWDREKAATNLTKHGVSFDEASTALGDPLSDLAVKIRSLVVEPPPLGAEIIGLEKVSCSTTLVPHYVLC